jgi:endonuclease/exonuclease/phosphatase (EEP) superfamily protein YafD
MGRWHWLLDLMSHFRWYYLLAALVWYAITSRRRSRLATAWLAIAVGANAWVIVPYWLPASRTPEGGESLSIISINLHTTNADHGRALAYIRDRNPDIVVCLEFNEDWAAAFRELDATYPHHVVRPEKGLFGIAVYSQIPLRDPQILNPMGGSPMVVTGIDRGENGCVLMATHPLAPVSAEWSSRRDSQLSAMGELAASEQRPVIVAGDLNATPWSHGFRAVAGPRGLRDSALGRGVQATWNARRWVPRIPIDHILVSPEIGVKSRAVGPDVGSDHLPVEASLVVP